MSTTTSDTNYALGFGNAGAGFTIEGVIQVDATVWTDAQAFAFFAAFEALPWPTGISPQASIQKTAGSTTQYTTDLASNPPSFT